MSDHEVLRSFIIPVIDFSPHSPYNINTLLEDLAGVPGEVICIFNSLEVFEALRSHPRIDKFCYNSLNAGVSRSWNMGINMSEGRAVFILNADLHVGLAAVEGVESALFTLDKAVIAGPQGSLIDYSTLKVARYFEKGTFDAPQQTHDVSGFFFGIHLERFLQHKLMFDMRYSPCFFEEWDMGLQVLQAGLACYAVPVTDFEHHWGVSQGEGERRINYFGRELLRSEIYRDNRLRFISKWSRFFSGGDQA
jgi:GT2 family glycosyltransferase